MHFPVVYERVWVRGCTYEFVVVQADYAARFATLSAINLATDVRRRPFCAIFAHSDFEASQASESVQEEASKIVHSSSLSVRIGRNAIRYMRETAAVTRLRVSKTQELITETDAVIERWKLLGCKP